MTAQPEWITLAHLLRPQGRKGELLADLFTDFPEHFTSRPVFLQTPRSAPRPIQVESHWLPVGRNAGRVVLKLAGIDSINDAETLANADIVIPASERLPLEDDAAYISDLIGCEVFTQAHPTGSIGSAPINLDLINSVLVGSVIDVEFPTSPDGVARLEDAAPLLTVLNPSGDEILIPYVHAYLKKLDTAAKRIEMDLPEGLLNLNTPTTPKNPK